MNIKITKNFSIKNLLLTLLAIFACGVICLMCMMAGVEGLSGISNTENPLDAKYTSGKIISYAFIALGYFLFPVMTALGIILFWIKEKSTALSYSLMFCAPLSALIVFSCIIILGILYLIFSQGFSFGSS